MATSNQVRTVIELFCKILEENDVGVVRAETLRQAKFNKESATQSLWTLLYCVVCYCKRASSGKKNQSTLAKTIREEDVIFVKSELQKWGYLDQSFSRLSHDMTSGSQELLLCLGWVIHTQALFDKIIAAHSSPLQQELLSFLNLNNTASYEENAPVIGSGNRNISLREQVQRQLMLCGKLRLAQRRLYMAYQELTSLKCTIRKSTEGVSIRADHNHLSPLEVHLLRHPESLKKMMTELERDNEQLQDLLDWRDKEYIFWEWMESVLNLRVKETGSEASSACLSETEEVYLPLPPDVGKEITMERAKLRDFILQHETSIDKMEQIIFRKKLSPVEIETLKCRLDGEISQLSQKLRNCGQGWRWDENHETVTPTRNISQLNSLVLADPHQKEKSKHILPSNQALRTARQAWVLNAAESAICSMESQVHQLETELRQLQTKNAEELQSVMEKDVGVVCVQPRFCRQFCHS